jgi:Zn-dependent M28 family amino/carboxypeptidase
MGLEGSLRHAAEPPPGLGLDAVVAMVNLDMLGTYDATGRVAGLGTFAGTPGRAILDVVLAGHPDLDVRLGRAAPDDDSDFDVFCEAGIPYVYFETADPACYHEACDDAARLDLPHLAELTSVLHDVVVGLGDDPSDLAATRAAVGCGGP